jgi:hypothetical protein
VVNDCGKGVNWVNWMEWVIRVRKKLNNRRESGVWDAILFGLDILFISPFCTGLSSPFVVIL